MPKSTLVLYGKTPDGWRKGFVILAKNGQPKPGVMLVAGEEVEATNLTYQIREYVNRRPVYLKLRGVVAYEEAKGLLVRRQKVRDLTALQEELGVGVKTPEQVAEEEADRAREEQAQKLEELAKAHAARPTLRKLLPGFLEKFARGSADTVYNYTYVSNLFVKVMEDRGTLYPEDITEMDVIAFDTYLADICGNTKVTRATRYGYARCFLRFVEREPNTVITLSEHKKLKFKPKKRVEVYSEAELEKLYEVASDRHRLIWKCYRMLGLREEELAFAFWALDVDLVTGLWKVRFKAKGTFPWNRELAWKSKDSEERDIPIPDDLLEELRTWKKQSKSFLVFPTLGNQADIKLLKALKSDWRKAGLNCGHCKGCLDKKKRECSRAKLKTFRSTYLTTMSGFTKPQNLQVLAGHSSIETTMKYLAVDKDVRAAVNDAFRKPPKQQYGVHLVHSA